MTKISLLPNDASPAGADILAGVENSNDTTSNFKLSDVLTYIQDNSINKLGYAQITSTFAGTSSATPQQITGLSTTVVVPAGGRSVKITVFAQDMFSSGTGFVSIWQGAVNTGTKLNQVQFNVGASHSAPCICVAIITPSSGSVTFNAGIQGDGSNAMSIESDGSNAPAFILTELL